MAALTAKVKEELVRVRVPQKSAHIAEAAALLRFAGRAELTGETLLLEATFDTRAAADRLRELLVEQFSVEPTVRTIGPGANSKATQHFVRITDGAQEVVRRLGLITRSGHPVVGLPPQVISGSVADNEAAWRGAFLAAGSLTEPGRASAVEVACPRPEAALALVGCARRLGVTAKTKQSRGVDRVAVRDAESIGALLTRMGAQQVRLEWEDKSMSRRVRTSSNRLANFDDANLRRSARAAITAAARVERAMELLADEVPEHLAEAGQLRIRHRHASLEELGRLADPQMTKDAVAGRIRRLLSMADKRAEELDIPDTHAAVTEDLFEEQ